MDKRRVGVRAIIYQDGRILAVKHKSKKDGKPKDFWSIPGGGLDLGESLESGLRREIKEELGVDITVGRLLFIQQFKSTRADCDEELEFFFLVENPEDCEVADISKSSHGTVELALCEYIDPAKEFVLPRFLSHVDIELYATMTQPVYIADLLDTIE